jgi:HK97 family phage major capsid protein
MPDVDIKEVLGEDFISRIEGLEAKAAGLVEKQADAEGDELTKVREELTEVQGTLDEMKAEKKALIQDAEKKALEEEVGRLGGVIEQLRSPDGVTFVGGAPAETKAVRFEEYYAEDSEYSFWRDVADSQRGDKKAMERLGEVQDETLEGKAAMTQGTGSAGGFLVPDQISQELLELRVYASVLENLFSRVDVTSDVLRITSVATGLTAGWVAELATKPEAELTFAEITASVFTIAGLSVSSNQLLKNSTRSIDRLINRDLAKRIATVAEIGYIDGTGSGQPTGILGTSGINSVVYTDATPTVPELLDAIVDAITAVWTNFLEAPTAIVMHPRTWAFIVKGREATSPSTYFIGAGSTAFGRRGNDPLPGYGSGQVPRGELFGLPVYTTPNIPTNKGGGTESRIIVGAFDEGLVLDSGGVRFDQSSHVYFTSNQTVFRGERDVGFTAARYPKAFSVISGTGLAGI